MKKKKEVEIPDLKELMSEDEKIQRYRRIVSNIKKSIDLEKLDAELARLHAGRLSRQLYGKHPSPDSLINAALQDAANRSRMAEIRVEATRQLSILEVAIDSVKKYIMHEYKDHMIGIKTKGERVGFAEQRLTSGVDFAKKVENMIERADFLIKDIDQTGFSLKHSIACLEILYASNNTRKNI